MFLKLDSQNSAFYIIHWTLVIGHVKSDVLGHYLAAQITPLVVKSLIVNSGVFFWGGGVGSDIRLQFQLESP